MGDQTTTDLNDVEIRLVRYESDGGKKANADDKKTNLKSDADNTTPELVQGTPLQGELNGEVRDTPRPRGRPRKARGDENVEKNDVKTSLRTRKRTYSESDDEAKFRGFEPTFNLYPGLEVINKLLADLKNVSPLPSKRIRRPTVKVLENADTEASENRSSRYVIEAETSQKEIKQDTDQESDMDVGAATESSDQEAEQKEESGSTVKHSAPNRRGRRSSQIASTSPRQGAKSDNYKKPLDQGWKREVVQRGTGEASQGRVTEVYYITPKNKKLRNIREVDKYLKTEKNTNLTTENFTFAKEPLGVKKSAEVTKDVKVVTKSQTDNVAQNKGTPRPSSPSSETDASVKNETPIQKKVAAKRGRPRINPKPDVGTPESDVTAVPSPKIKPKEAQNDAQATPKKGLIRKDPIKNSPMTRRSQQSQRTVSPHLHESELMDTTPVTEEHQQAPVAEKTIKTNKRLKRTNLQEPCSIRCSTSTGGIPSLQCTICLCLYHAECVGCLEEEVGDNYICKNCKDDSDEILPPATSTLTPPPLIPISLLSSNPTTKYKSQGLISLPKLQRISRDENQSLPKLPKPSTNLPIFSSNIKPNDKKNDYFGNNDVTSSLPAQNLAFMNGKKYIVIPKDNAMAVQPAITHKREKNRPNEQVSTASSIKRDLPIQNTASRQNLQPSTSNFDQFLKKHDDELSKDKIDNSKNDVTERDNEQEARQIEHIENSSNNVNEVEKNDVKKSNVEESSIEESNAKKSFIEQNIVAQCDTEKSNVEQSNIRTDIDQSCSNNNVENIADDNNVETRKKEEEVINQENVKLCIEAENNERKKATPPIEVDQRRYHIANACAYYDAFPRVFQYLKVQELLRASRVCKMWRDLVAHPSLWRTVRMKNSQVTDWDGFAEALNRYQTQHLDLRKILMPDGENIWAKFIEVLPKIKSLKKLELCRCPGSVVEAVIQNCSQLETFSAMSIKCDVIDLSDIRKFKNCTELRLKAITGMTLSDSMKPLCELTQLIHLSLTSVKELGRKDIHLVKDLVNLEVLELGECSDLPENFGTDIIANLPKLERLRLEKGQGACYTFNILEGVSQSPNLTQLELVNFDIKKGFDTCLSKCKNIKRLLIIPTYISQSATSNHMILGGVTQLKETLTNFIWGVTLELLRVTDLFVDQCAELKKRIKGDAIPVLKPIPCAELIEDILKDAVKNAENTELAEMERRNSEDQTSQENLPEVDILTLLQLQKLLLLALPTTRVKILKIPFHATWRQSLLDSAMQ